MNERIRNGFHFARRERLSSILILPWGQGIRIVREPCEPSEDSQHPQRVLKRTACFCAGVGVIVLIGIVLWPYFLNVYINYVMEAQSERAKQHYDL